MNKITRSILVKTIDLHTQYKLDFSMVSIKLDPNQKDPVQSELKPRSYRRISLTPLATRTRIIYLIKVQIACMLVRAYKHSSAKVRTLQTLLFEPNAQDPWLFHKLFYKYMLTRTELTYCLLWQSYGEVFNKQIQKLLSPNLNKIACKDSILTFVQRK